MDALVEYAQALGYMVAHFRPGQVKPGVFVTNVAYDGKGFPDLVLVGRLRLIFVECKGKGIRALRPDQEVWVEALRRTGNEVYVWNPGDWKDIEEVLK